ncbi:MAG: 16S rRNA (cytosine(967)-C(5))-methyltransferase RsmB [Chlorobiaceae bacterium]|nr:16S rRNA (cytosine(967)-C(5))-methyltransferase RsmB [Chlorobiaceae bacterium]MBA4309166.1 16S rRNA (cytosine(967)-C(5))-methyltransferase RsmB [Chlorobiaceae bacterium]
MSSIEEHKIHDIHTGVRGLAVKILNRVERTDAYLEKLLDNEMRNSELSGQDKALLYEIVHGVVRWMGRLDWILAGFYKGQFSKALPLLKNALRVALYQILFLDKVPEYAAVNEAVEFVKKLHGQKFADITNAVLRNIIKTNNEKNLRFPNPENELLSYLSTFYSHPSWLVKRWLNRFGREQVELLLAANNERPLLTLRPNLLKVSLTEFQDLLNSVDLKYSAGTYLPEFFKLKTLSNITSWKYFTEGYFNIQDESTGFSCKLLAPQKGERILDLCAAPGGKSSFIADMIQNDGEIIAIDKFESRTNQVTKAMERLGITCVNAINVDAHAYENSDLFDRIIADVPCTGLGTISKKPDIKWKKELLDIRKSNILQLNLLNKAATLVKKDGVIVYSTCTTEPEENFEVIESFLKTNENFIIQNASEFVSKDVVDENGCVQTLPHIHKMDGAFAARLLRVK